MRAMAAACESDASKHSTRRRAAATAVVVAVVVITAPKAIGRFAIAVVILKWL